MQREEEAVGDLEDDSEDEEEEDCGEDEEVLGLDDDDEDLHRRSRRRRQRNLEDEGSDDEKDEDEEDEHDDEEEDDEGEEEREKVKGEEGVKLGEIPTGSHLGVTQIPHFSSLASILHTLMKWWVTCKVPLTVTPSRHQQCSIHCLQQGATQARLKE
ncbi:hypothetical protein C8J55DRAFT_552548 [Lentinula edodes]|uniref:Uncharacterized protein n=1 Tax=Lentinula lateritia TaxID=40482 RepID=A0A9W8ZTK2_9AGAR|nr:hypothetical protein C8J55DRAFT_552548 [Lentinula edodes]